MSSMFQTSNLFIRRTQYISQRIKTKAVEKAATAIAVSKDLRQDKLLCPCISKVLHYENEFICVLGLDAISSEDFVLILTNLGIIPEPGQPFLNWVYYKNKSNTMSKSVV